MGLELKVEQKQRVYQKQIEQARILQNECTGTRCVYSGGSIENPLIELEEMMDVPIEELVKKDVRETDETEAEVSEDTDWRYRRASVARRLVDSTGENRKVLLI